MKQYMTRERERKREREKEREQYLHWGGVLLKMFTFGSPVSNADHLIHKSVSWKTCFASIPTRTQKYKDNNLNEENGEQRYKDNNLNEDNEDTDETVSRWNTRVGMSTRETAASRCGRPHTWKFYYTTQHIIRHVT